MDSDDNGESVEKTRPGERSISDVFETHSRFLSFFLEELKRRRELNSEEIPCIQRFELTRFTLSDRERQLSQLNRGDRPRGLSDKEFHRRRAHYLQSRNKYFWDDSQLTRTLNELKRYGLLHQPHKNGPYSLSTSYYLKSSLNEIVETIQMTPLEKTTLLENLGVVCGIPESCGHLELREVEESLESSLMRLHKLRSRMAIERCTHFNTSCAEEEWKDRLLTFILLFLRTMRDRAWDDGGREFRAKEIIAGPQAWASTQRLLPPGGRKLREVTLLDLIGPEMMSALTPADWDKLERILKRSGFDYDLESDGLPCIQSWEYEAFLREYDRPLVIALELGMDLVHPTRMQLDLAEETLRKGLKCMTCEHRPTIENTAHRNRRRKT